MSVNYEGHSTLACMIKGHIQNWREGLLELEKQAQPADPLEGTDDKAYWQHELKALQDIENAVDQLLKEHN